MAMAMLSGTLDMQPPKDPKTRLSPETWILVEVLRRYYRSRSIKAAAEMAVTGFATHLQGLDPDEFNRIMGEVRAELEGDSDAVSE